MLFSGLTERIRALPMLRNKQALLPYLLLAAALAGGVLWY